MSNVNYYPAYSKIFLKLHDKGKIEGNEALRVLLFNPPSHICMQLGFYSKVISPSLAN